MVSNHLRNNKSSHEEAARKPIAKAKDLLTSCAIMCLDLGHRRTFADAAAS